MRHALRAFAALAIIAAPGAQAADADRQPTPFWSMGSKPADPSRSYAFYPVAEGAIRPCLHAGRATSDPELVAACAAGDATYRRRVHHMVAGMNMDAEAERRAHCAQMLSFVHQDFQHIEGRRAGFRVRSKPDLARACEGRAFRLSGFFGEAVQATAIDANEVQVLTCYFHDQTGDPGVKGDGHILTNGREAIPRLAVETIRRDPDGAWRIRLHIALDADSRMVRDGCGALGRQPS